jgi:hypothetical protein
MPAPERPDIRKIANDIRDALATYPPDALIDILTYVFQSYVVEAPPQVHLTQPDQLAELEGLSFAEVIQLLQVRLDLPELGLFEVEGGRVGLRVGNQIIPLIAQANRAGQMEVASLTPAAPPPPEPLPAPTGPQPPADARPRPRQPGVYTEEVPSSQLRPPPRQEPASTAPPPRRGLVIGDGSRVILNQNSQQQRGAPSPPAPGQQAAPPPAQPAQPATKAGPTSAGEENDEDNPSTRRFKLLDWD